MCVQHKMYFDINLQHHTRTKIRAIALSYMQYITMHSTRFCVRKKPIQQTLNTGLCPCFFFFFSSAHTNRQSKKKKFQILLLVERGF